MNVGSSVISRYKQNEKSKVRIKCKCTYHVLAVVAAAAIVAIAVVLVPFLVLYPKWITKDVSLDLPVLLETTLRLDPFIQARDSLDVHNTSGVRVLFLSLSLSLSYRSYLLSSIDFVYLVLNYEIASIEISGKC